jgi:5-methylcytosine-specific restriction endonuclease McrA
MAVQKLLGPYTQKQYVEALSACRDKISDVHRALLRFHVAGRRRRVSVNELAKSAGYPDPQIVYAAYGRLGHLIAQSIDRSWRRVGTGEVIWTRAIGVDERNLATGDVTWALHPTFVAAVRKLKWPMESGQDNTKAAQHYLFVTGPEYEPEKVTARSPASWSASQHTRKGDLALVYVKGLGIAFEWKLISDAEQDDQWGNVCKVRRVRQFDPPIDIGTLRAHIPRKVWAAPHTNFRGFKQLRIPNAAVRIIEGLHGAGSTATARTPGSGVRRVQSAAAIRRSRPHLEALNEKFAEEVSASRNSDPAARLARLSKAPPKARRITVETVAFRRNADVVAEVLGRAEGYCEQCRQPAPFKRPDGTPYLEVHHLITLAAGGDDTVENAVALCPNCHRKAHFGKS